MSKRALYLFAGFICFAVLGLAGWQTAGLPPSSITGLITAGTGATITGSGTLASPYNITLTGAGGTLPAAVTVSGTGVTELDFIPGTNPCFSASYQRYVITLDNVHTDSATTNLGIQVYTGGAFDTTSGHYGEGRALIQTLGGSTGVVQAGNTNSMWDLDGVSNTVTSANTYRGSIEVVNPLAAQFQGWNAQFTKYAGSTSFGLFNAYAYNQNVSVTGFRVYASGSTFDGTVTCQPMPH